ncbi:helix-turn-helix domain-containing protein [Halomonas sp. PGE1]|uniref:helix-turn-helix transcriptional regulator n=1 Tax=Halomonas sp. PGE1 TaxID=2730360 RepID=UPI001474C6C0|nr:helix-turn-helix domain-containing protein [Halomonas sp. PGE1]
MASAAILTPAEIRAAVDERFLRDTDLAERYGIHRNTIWRWVRDGKLPRPVAIGGSTRWRLSEIVAFELASQ